jgi:uncharacterized membrane protein
MENSIFLFLSSSVVSSIREPSTIGTQFCTPFGLGIFLWISFKRCKIPSKLGRSSGSLWWNVIVTNKMSVFSNECNLNLTLNAIFCLAIYTMESCNRYCTYGKQHCACLYECVQIHRQAYIDTYISTDRHIAGIHTHMYTYIIQAFYLLCFHHLIVGTITVHLATYAV